MQAHRIFRGCPRALGALGAVVALGACSGSDDYVIVTVAARPAVHDARSLTVALANGGTTRMDSLALRDQAFPVTFSISTPGRTGDLAITVDATDEDGLVVGHGTATTTTAAPEASVRLDATDFVVNTDFASDQFPTSYFEAAGFQLAALPDGTWTAAFADACVAGSCNLFGRQFDKTGKPIQTQVAAGTNMFNLTTIPTNVLSTPAIAASASTTLAVWNYTSVDGLTTGIACRALDAAGRATADQTIIAPDSADVVAVAALSTGNFVASWNSFATSPGVVRTSIIKPDCTALTAMPLDVSTNADGISNTSSVASSGDQALFVWTLGGDLHIRLASPTGSFTIPDSVLVTQTATDEVFQARVAAASRGGFVIAARWSQLSRTGPGRIELFRIDAAGQRVGGPTLVTDRSASDFDNRQSFGIASRPDGTIMIAWHTCGDLGDGSRCGVFGRILRDTGDPVTDVFSVPTTTEGDQQLPSVVGLPDAFVAMWADGSGQAPDVSEQAVRARIIYLPGM